MAKAKAKAAQANEEKAPEEASEFASDWHREAYIADTEREIAGASRRVEELTAANVHPDEIAAAQVMVDNATAELARVNKKR